jgi:2-polyprenyl-3-methyl-5-hydroxy-6-metoxy-1,4-benzoquinol methylase
MEPKIWNPGELAQRDACPLCKTPAPSQTLVSRRDSLGVKRCAVCQVLFVDPVPVAEALRRCYGAGYFQESTSSQPFGSSRDYFSPDASVAGHGYSDIASRLSLRNKSVLEIGCATGALLYRLQAERPARLVGIDISDVAVSFGKKRYGLDLRCTTLGDAGFSESEFDVILMLDVVEHVFDPERFFAEAIRCLKVGGAVFLRTPNANSYDVAGVSWTYLHSGLEHVQYLSYETISWLAKNYGLAVDELWSEGCPAILPYRRFHRSRLLRLLWEPRTIIANAYYRWKQRTLAAKGLGADFFAVLRKPNCTLTFPSDESVESSSPMSDPSIS